MTWRFVPKAVRDRYERRFGIQPPGYRGTGRVQWFDQWHPDKAPCCKCGLSTDRFVIGTASVKTVAWGGATYQGRVLCAETHYPFCWSCERRAAIAVLQQRQSLGIASEVGYLAELEAEELERAA